jgi:3-hydroxyacyl-CoA dehydrogenase
MDPDKVHKAETLEEALKNCDLVIEAIYEDLNVKCELFKEMGVIAGPNIIFASNTSSLSISKMAEASGRPNRFIGLHFFNPPLIMRLVEVVVHPGIDPDIREQVKNFILTIKKHPVVCKDSPGFVVNRILIPIINEAFFILEETDKEKIEAANEIDSAIVKEEILLMGPYNLADLTGIDTIYHVADIIYKGFNQSPRYKRSPLIDKYYSNKQFGRKNKRGIYYYENQLNDPDLNPPLDSKGQKLELIASPDFNTLDLVSVMINEAFRVVEEGIVEDFNDIEVSMELGTRWPKGPFQMVKEIGWKRILDHLLKLYNQSDHNPRYEPSSLFKSFPENLEEFFEN